MNITPTFLKPPVAELVLGTQFSPITKLTAGHFGLFWKELGPDWNDPSDGPIIEDEFETFDHQRWIGPKGVQIRIEPSRAPGRFLIGHQGKDRLIQMQATRFHLNWKKGDGFYPSYKKLIAEFEQTFEKFCTFIQANNLGKVILNQWEITYIDSFPKDEHWSTPADWPKVLPGLFAPLWPTDDLGLALENRAAEWSYEIEAKRGRLHIAAQVGRLGSSKNDSLLLHMTARGPIEKGSTETLRQGLDLGHEAAVGFFLRIVDRKIQSQWGE